MIRKCALVLVLYVSFAVGEHNLIVDTDAGFDVDDIAAITVANKLADMNETKIIAISHTNAYSLGIGAVSSIMEWYDRSNVPLGSYKGEWARDPHAGIGNADKYVSDLVHHYPSRVNSSDQVETAVRVYRKALSGSSDGSVSIASIGITTNMRDLVLSEPDDISPLSGHDLIAQKVSKIVWMDGMYNFGCAEHDTFDWLGDDKGCRGSAQDAVMNFPKNVRQIFSPVGIDVFTGKPLSSCSPVTLNPVKQAFEDLGVLTSGRSSWDPIAVLIAVRGIQNAFLKEQTVSVQVAESGKETFETVSDSNQTRVYFENDQDKVSVRILLDNLLCDQPGPSSNLLWTKALGENCYGPRDGSSASHGADDLESPPSASCGFMNLESCQKKCLDLKTCTAVTMSELDSKGFGQCYRKTNIVLSECDSGTSFSTYIRRDWVLSSGSNCYESHGAVDIDGLKSCGYMTTRACRDRCVSTPGCTGFVMQGSDHSGKGSCYRKSNITLSKCDHHTNAFDTYIGFLNDQ